MADPRAWSYLGRPVAFARLDALDAEDAVVLVWSGARLAEDQRAAYVEAVVRCNPLAVMVGGPDAARTFDRLLEVLSREAEARPMMTGVSDAELGETLERFFLGVWPHEARMAGWARYVIASDDDARPELERAVAEFLDGAG